MNVVEETEAILHCTRSCHTYTKGAQMCLASVEQRPLLQNMAECIVVGPSMPAGKDVYLCVRVFVCVNCGT